MDISPMDYEAYQQWIKQMQEQMQMRQMREEGLQASGALPTPQPPDSEGSEPMGEPDGQGSGVGKLGQVLQFIQAANPQVRVGNMSAGVGVGAGGGQGQASANGTQVLTMLKTLLDAQQRGARRGQVQAGGPARIR